MLTWTIQSSASPQTSRATLPLGLRHSVYQKVSAHRRHRLNTLNGRDSIEKSDSQGPRPPLPISNPVLSAQFRIPKPNLPNVDGHIRKR